ncbi:MAG TPA: hypothetical protein VFS77_00765 [Pyrinomonadaceae bacterium]|nr:hypothetical protein [Pyrinomonadaceae bacterium]
MVTRVNYLPVVVTFCTLLCLTANPTLAQSTAGDFQRILREKTTFEAGDFAALEQGETVVKVVPATDKREVAVSGLVNVRTTADHFLRSYLGGLGHKKNEAVLETGRFGKAPAVADLQQLTIDPQDIEDLKQCAVGNCEVKLSAKMIERFRREVDWQAPDYQTKAAELLKTMLVEYVSDYVARGPAAFITYHDKRFEVRLADEHKALSTTSGYLNDLFRDSQSSLRMVEEAIVWSKVKFGLKPVLLIDHVKVYRDERDHGPQVLVAAHQIYANHYFTSSLALTAFVSVPDANPAAYLVYENRSRTDGLQGAFSKFKRGMIENKAVAGLKSILENTKFGLEGAAYSAAATTVHKSTGWGQRLFGGIRPALWVLTISALLALIVLGKRRIAKPARTAPERART